MRAGWAGLGCAAAAPLPAPAVPLRFCLLTLIAAKEVSVLETGEKTRTLACDIVSGGGYRDGIIAIHCPGGEMRLTFARLVNSAVI